ncbi:DBH-like monooxygenase protein 1 isoform X3 [Branchiostoma floridae]|uniref:DBH-like monooxygenase protein 1 isoform X3 n=1 Tax=Branchiostoma floridae TaxID=7739 RepID=A0A9J7N738_BRAFL|nr:DBH-like monooxygenase protein 1 isoform X3 [Branchiostoma floridae]
MSVLTVAVVVALLCGDSASAATDLIHHEVLDENGDFLLFWTYDGAQIELEARVRTRGWVGLGLSPNGGMPGSDIVIGWVKDGQAYLTDRYADEKALPPEDESQDWELLSGYENDTHTVLRFKRKLQTCDVRDRVINKDTQRVLWAWNDRDPDDVTGPAYHTHRGVRSSILLRNDIEAESLPNVIRSHDVVMTNTAIPSKQTTYWCKLVEMPPLQTKHHIFKDLSFPSHVGYPIGDEDDGGQVLMEVHYDNPEQKEGMTDNSGLRLLYTPELRQHDVGVLLVSQSVDHALVIPPRAVEYNVDNFCHQECLDTFLDEAGEPVQVFGVMPHAHLLAKKMRTTLIRDGVETVLSSDDNYDFNLQYIRMLEEEVTIKKGDTIMTRCTYNSEHKTEPVYGGLSTENEMCDSFLFYYPRMSLRWCESHAHPLNILGFAGVQEIGYSSEAPVFIDSIPIVKPANMSNMTYLDVVESIVWGQDKAQQYSQHLRSGNFVSRCGGKMQTDGDTILYTKESLLPHPTVPAAAPVFTCSTSSGTVGPQLSAPLPFMAVMTSLTILFTL